ncbi:unnamed protein product [Schistosoma curassoni]|uniref:CPSF_A domain-containing protein n=1 Tax=Schistosoma curassoni TaxID=6186 RepID=A0A183JHN1_9TREM|nr:unnamed protein product [Schistosoma curassoni]
MVVVSSQQQVTDLGFVTLGTRQQHLPVILRELVPLDGFDPTFKNAIISAAALTFCELGRRLDRFLLQYGNAKHSGAKGTPSKLLGEMILHPNMSYFESAEVKYYHGNDIRPTTRIAAVNFGKSMIRILDFTDLSTYNRHVDKLQFQEPYECALISAVDPNINENILGYV